VIYCEYILHVNLFVTGYAIYKFIASCISLQHVLIVWSFILCFLCSTLIIGVVYCVHFILFLENVHSQ